MVKNWLNAYSELKDYVQKNPAVEISKTAVILPDEARPGFYKLFDNIRKEFIEQLFSEQISSAKVLGVAYFDAEAALLTNPGLKSIYIDQPLRWFLTDPVDGISRRVFDLTFELVQGQITPEQYAERAERMTAPLVLEYYQQGYVRWVGLNLMRMLSPTSYFVTDVDDQYTDPDLSQAYNRPGFETVHPKMLATDKFSFSMNEYTSVLPPNIIFFSGLLQCYIGLNVDFHRVFKWVREPSKNREWLNIEDMIKELGPDNYWPDLVLSKSDTPEDLLMVAEWKSLSRFDVIITVSPASSYDAESVTDRMEPLKRLLKPRLGQFIVCRGTKAAPAPRLAVTETPATPISGGTSTEPAGQESAMGLPTYPDIIEADLETSKLEPIIEALKA